MLENFNAYCELCKIIKHFFPDLIKLLSHVKEHRCENYTRYKGELILFTRILSAIFQISSMRKVTEEFNNQICIDNIKNMLDLEKLEELPHWNTINNYLENLNFAELEKIIPKLVNHLLRMRSFESSRIRNQYWQVIIDGTGLCGFNKRHCPHCLTKTYKNEDGSIKHIEYYHYILEAKIVFNGNIVISIATEFVENEQPNISKQDCELKAFYRLANKLKSFFPKLPVCLTMDSLYACKPVFDICQKNNWRYIIRFKDGSIPSVAEEFHTLKNLEPNQIHIETFDDINKQYKYVNAIPYENHSLNLIEYIQSNKGYPFIFVTDLSINKRNYKRLIDDGRRRWKIENEGFNTQKNHGYFLEHLFSKNYNAMKNHYFLIQIGHMIAQLLENAVKIWRAMKISLNAIHQIVKQSFQTICLSKDDLKKINRRMQFRFL